jgi:hypothetical protein
VITGQNAALNGEKILLNRKPYGEVGEANTRAQAQPE